MSPPAAGGIGIYMMAPKAPYLPSGTVLHTSRGRSPQPVREASAGPGQNPWRPGPKARRRHQPSPAKAGVNLREYWKAPPRSRSRSQPRREAPEPSSPSGLVHRACQPSGIQLPADSSHKPMVSLTPKALEPPLHFFPYLWYIESDIFNSLQ